MGLNLYLAIFILLAITALYTITGEFVEQSKKSKKSGEPAKREEGRWVRGKKRKLERGVIYGGLCLKGRGGEEKKGCP